MITITIKGQQVTLNTYSTERGELYKAQDLLKAIGMDTKNASRIIENFNKVMKRCFTDWEIVSVQGKSGGTYLTKEQLLKLKEYVDPTVDRRVYTQREHGALCAIEQVLGIKLIRQYRVGNYRIDGYCKETNTAYEIDEEGHNSSTAKEQDRIRQQYIEKKLGCKFVRIDVSR